MKITRSAFFAFLVVSDSRIEREREREREDDHGSSVLSLLLRQNAKDDERACTMATRTSPQARTGSGACLSMPDSNAEPTTQSHSFSHTFTWTRQMSVFVFSSSLLFPARIVTNSLIKQI
jgi:hypothetical protein